MCWTPLCANKHKQRKQDMRPVTNNWYLGCSVRLYLQLFVTGRMSYLRCSVPLYPQLFVGGLMYPK
jgi:hypothetical protein